MHHKKLHTTYCRTPNKSHLAVQVGARSRQLQYDGDWVRGRREGHGTSHYYNGETYQGVWVFCAASMFSIKLGVLLSCNIA